MTQLVNNFFEVSPANIQEVVETQSMADNIEALRQTIELANQTGEYSSEAPREAFTVPSMEEAFADTEADMLSGNHTIANNVCLTAISAVIRHALDQSLPFAAEEAIKIAGYRYIGLEAGGVDAVELEKELDGFETEIQAMFMRQAGVFKGYSLS